MIFKDRFLGPGGNPRLLTVVMACLAGILVNLIFFNPRLLAVTYRDYSDFRHFYVGAHLFRTGDLYDADAYLDVQRRQFGMTIPILIPNRLPFYYAAISPLAQLPYRMGQGIWLAVMTLAAACFIASYSGAIRARMAIAACWSLPLLLSLAMGQDIALVMLFMAAALRAIYRGKHWWRAGLLLAPCLIKFHLILLLPILMVIRRKWRMAAGFLCGAAFLLIVSFPAAGWNWPLRYVPTVLNPVGSPNLDFMPNLHGLAFLLGLSTAAEIAASLVVVGMVCWVAHRGPFSIAAAAALLGSFLLSQHAYFQDCAMLIPSLLMLIRPANGALVRAGAWILLLPTLYRFGFGKGGAAVATLLLALLILVTLDRSPYARRLGLRARPAES